MSSDRVRSGIGKQSKKNDGDGKPRKKRNRKNEAQNEALADVLWRLEQLANFVPSGRS